MFVKLLKQLVTRDWCLAIERCNTWGAKRVDSLRPNALLDVGCGDGALLVKHLTYKPTLFCGIEAAPSRRQQAEARGIQVSGCDLNGRWPYSENTFDVVHSAQVIEHLHNTRCFVEEMYRVLKPGGTAVVGSENLTSLLNLGAMVLGYTPFTLMRVCGWYLGNPLGLHYREKDDAGVPITDPAFAGVTGHIRALSVLQAKELFEMVGFQTKAWSVGLMPVPEWMGRRLERFMPRRGHFLLVEATKPKVGPPRPRIVNPPRVQTVPKKPLFSRQEAKTPGMAAHTLGSPSPGKSNLPREAGQT